MIVVFGGAPLLLWHFPGIFRGGGLFIFLTIMSLACGAALFFDPSFDRKKLWNAKPVIPAMGWVIGRWLIAAVVLVTLFGLLAGRVLPGLTIAMPTVPFRLFNRQLLSDDIVDAIALAVSINGYPAPLAWLIHLVCSNLHLALPIVITVFYPWLSVYPQNVIYRAFFCHRYRPILGSGWPLVFVNAAAFSFGHIMFNNWVVILLTLVGGVIFTRTYLKSRSLLLATTEHAIYGLFCFYLGVGVFLVYGAS